MFDHSSISSSSARDSWGWVWCLAILILVRAGLALWEPPWRDGHEIANTRAYLKAAKHRDVRVVAFGSSRLNSAFVSPEWARRAGLRPDQVLNLSVNNGQFWDARFMLREAGGLPDSVELVLIEAARWNFNRNRIAPLTEIRTDYPEHFRQQGGLRDRLSVDGWIARASLVAEMIWPTYQRRGLAAWLHFATTRWSPVPSLPIRSPHWDEKQHAAIRRQKFLQANSIVLDHFHEPAMSSFALRNFRALIGEIRSQGARVVVVHLPTRPAYERAIRRDTAKSKLVELIDNEIDSILDDGVYAVGCRLAGECGLTQSVFVDYGHFNYEGARAFTGFLFDEVDALRSSRSP